VTRVAAAAFVVILLVIAPVSVGAQANDEPAPRQPAIVLLAIDDLTLPYVRLIYEAFSETVAKAPRPVALYFESLDGARFGAPGYLESVRGWLRQKYADRHIDVVVPLGQDTYDFLAAGRGEPWPDARILAADMSSVEATLPQTSAVVLESDISEALRVIRAVLPDTERIAFIWGASAVEQARYTSYSAQARRDGLDTVVLGGLTLEQMLGRVAELPEHTVLIAVTPTVAADGRLVPLKQLVAAVSAVASVPLFTFGAQDVGAGAVGGHVRDWSRVGHLLAVQALERLRQPATGTVAIPLSDYTSVIFDDRQLRRWGIPESRLPAGSDVRFREPSLWRDRRGLVLAAIAIIDTQLLLIAGLLVERRRRHTAEAESRHNLEESRRHLVANAHLDRRAAMGELATALAHEINQPLNSILQNVDVADMLLTAQPTYAGREELGEILGDIRKADLRASEVIRRMRTMLQRHELESETIDLNAVARDAMAITQPDASARRVALDAHLDPTIPTVQGDAIHLQQVLLNLLMNAMDAVSGMPDHRRLVTLRTTHDDTEVRVSVADRGRGITAERIADIFEPFVTTKDNGAGMGMGLAIARSIVEAHDGRLGAENNSDGGATVWFALPLSSRVSA
jgi:signal transduction histidine kinase